MPLAIEHSRCSFHLPASTPSAMSALSISSSSGVRPFREAAASRRCTGVGVCLACVSIMSHGRVDLGSPTGIRALPSLIPGAGFSARPRRRFLGVRTWPAARNRAASVACPAIESKGDSDDGHGQGTQGKRHAGVGVGPQDRRVAYRRHRQWWCRHPDRPRTVINLITVEPRAKPEDVKRRIADTIKRNAALDASAIHVETTNGTVHLEGTVHSLWEKRMAEQAAASAPGVKEVDNDLAVVI